ncbi:MAG: NAD-dependent epimerase/dehydratase family protein, partial [Candidatus Azambacteria bacterium]|nr:NAD-dependent epimerase/dehydratase family protein [Candidatus Azambacteria bacterium]
MEQTSTYHLFSTRYMINLANKKILVTGGGGFLGSHVVDGLLRRGVPKENIFIPSSKDFDLRKRENCEKVVGSIDVVVHLAGVTGNADLHRAHPGEIFYDNLIMGVELMESSRRAGVEKFVSIG